MLPRGEAKAGWSARAVSLMDDQLSGPRGVWQRVEMRKSANGDCEFQTFGRDIAEDRRRLTVPHTHLT